MIEAHTLDAWTRQSARETAAFQGLRLLGGLAAPLFLFLAGAALVLSAERLLDSVGNRRAAGIRIVRRGLEIYVLAFLFRLQALIVTPGGPLVTFFRVDILNIMGPAMVAAGVLWMMVPNRPAAASTAAVTAATIAMTTPLLQTAAWVDRVPIWVQWYLRPSGEHTTFTLFPWTGFLFAGASLGCLFASARDGVIERRLLTGITLAGVVLVLTGSYMASFPTIYTSASSFWTTSPTYFAIRVGVVLLSLGIIAAILPLARRVRGPFAVLERFGRNSLFVYWIHVELVYGYATWAIHGRLPTGITLLAFALFCALMFWAITLREQLALLWPGRTRPVMPAGTSLKVE
jgi:uncharacterized membrane protein